MDETTAKLAEQIKRNPAALQALMQSRDGKALMRLLTQEDQGAGLQKAVQSAVRGNTAEMVQMMNRIMQTADGAALIQRINQAVQQK